MYQVELVWNRSFDFVPHGELWSSLDDAIRYANILENMGDGASVKKTRVTNHLGKVVYAYGKKITE